MRSARSGLDWEAAQLIAVTAVKTSSRARQ
jgi:hypothetical protein